MKETSKAIRRRWVEDFEGTFPWKKIFTGNGIDIGCGDDKLPFENCMGWDAKDGDANRLDELLPSSSFDYLHASHVLEHMTDPADALRRWIMLLRPGGHAVIMVPDFDAYEKRQFPSVFNPDHKVGFSLHRKIFGHAPLIFVPEFLSLYNVLICRLILKNFDFNAADTIDQTWNECDGVECGIEFVIQKPI
jgi:SAM-dependent methyltransferase